MKVHGFEKSSIRAASVPMSIAVRDASVSRAWIRSCILAAVLAVTVSALVSLLVTGYLVQYRSGVHNVVRVELIAITSVLEGALIGYFQWRVLRGIFPTISGTMWVGATMIAAGSGCLLSWLPTSFALTTAVASRMGDTTVGTAAAVNICLVTGALIGLVWGVAQYAVLRLHVHQGGGWVLASVAAWTISFVPVYFAAFVPDRTTSPLAHVVVAAAAGLVLGSTLGLVHGRVLVALRSRLLVPHMSR
jgi:hypothetical protein